ncbi:MAG: hypothetical protein M1834_006733 [Cirrosporium novae-zelandiae]|nr:MAG: hypothetical protein M1834_006733 [Cirrosporium novae-zelandiae]
MERHLARHQQELALFSLPCTYDDDENLSEPDPESNLLLREASGDDCRAPNKEGTEAQNAEDSGSTDPALQESSKREPISSQFQSEETVCVRALRDYRADDQTKLSFRQGDAIRVLTRCEDGWWVGEINGLRGFFPSDYCTTTPDITSTVYLLPPPDPIVKITDKLNDMGLPDDKKGIKGSTKDQERGPSSGATGKENANQLEYISTDYRPKRDRRIFWTCCDCGGATNPIQQSQCPMCAHIYCAFCSNFKATLSTDQTK